MYQATAADKREAESEPGLAGSLNQTWSLPVLRLLHLSTDFPCCPRQRAENEKSSCPRIYLAIGCSK